MPDKDLPNILYVDDEPDNLVTFKAEFRRYYNVYVAQSGKEGIDILRNQDIHLIVTDQRMPEMSGVQFLEAVLPDFPEPVRMILTGFTDIDAIIKAINTGRVFRYITKPWDPTEMKIILDSALKYYQLEKQNRELVSNLQQQVLSQKRILNLFQKYVPKKVVEDTLKSEDEAMLITESRIISVLFCDIRNFTRATYKLETAEVVKFLNDYFSAMTECAKVNRGNVNKFLGDGILALFGAPLSYIDNQYNAIKCGLAMLDSLKAINKIYADKIPQEFTLTIGINTGEAIVGNIGSFERMEYTAIGSTVNVAYKIAAAAHSVPNSLLISESTYSSVAEFIEVEKMEEELPGIEGKTILYRVLGKKNE